ncbi:MAG: hypothetical protein Q8Q09_08080 [Deltaproteobacteria bacterium]|nr:hypothetical protein [Deltaproteobacteria bacterium]
MLNLPKRWALLAGLTLGIVSPIAHADPALCPHDPAPSLHTLLSLLPSGDGGALSRSLFDVRLMMAELDGAGPTEAVLSASRESTYGPEEIIWVFSAQAGSWVHRATSHYAINRESGNVDAEGRRGVVVLRSVRVGAGCQELLRVEHLRTNFQPQPQSSRQLILYALDREQLSPVFGCTLQDTGSHNTVGFSWQDRTLSVWARAGTVAPISRYRWRAGRFETTGPDSCHSSAFTAAR